MCQHLQVRERKGMPTADGSFIFLQPIVKIFIKNENKFNSQSGSRQAGDPFGCAELLAKFSTWSPIPGISYRGITVSIAL